ncbi:14278_t:CDS:2 [Racocetra fulgida]|uniref:14278_t:CDS:1 n=1 Tax=Racocetra fulgida TaxID=60492 RepID=A0A9N9AVK0_9GLOM|nr:14278_t:CDS:2 [Racocetra fulgida]
MKTKKIVSKKTASEGKHKVIKNQHPGNIYRSRVRKKTLTFTQLEQLIHQLKKTAGRQKLLANQQTRRQKKEATLRVQQAKQASRQQKQQRLKQIYSYFRQQLNKQDPKQSLYYSPYLDLPPHLSSYQYVDNNPFVATRKYYYRAISAWQNSLEREGEVVPEEEIALDRYGNPLYKNVPTWEEQVKKRVHEVAQKQYIEAHGTELEKQI